MNVVLEGETAPMTFGRLIDDLSSPTGDVAQDRRNASRVSRLRGLLRAAGWPSIEPADRRKVIAYFDGITPATLGLSAGSFATYKSDILAVLPKRPLGERKRGIRDIAGRYRELYDRVQEADLPHDFKLISGSFLVYLHDAGLAPSDLTTEALKLYYYHRLDVSSKTERACQKHVRRIAALCSALAVQPAFKAYGFRTISHPFGDGRDKYGVDAGVFGGLLAEFDGPVTAWLRGERSRDGDTYQEFLARLDSRVGAASTDKKALLNRRMNRRPSATEEERRSAGFLTVKEPGQTARSVNAATASWPQQRRSTSRPAITSRISPNSRIRTWSPLRWKRCAQLIRVPLGRVIMRGQSAKH